MLETQVSDDGSGLLLQQEVEANLPRLTENQSVGEATRAGHAFIANLKSDDRADNQAAHPP
jgi:hypothetical protein